MIAGQDAGPRKGSLAGGGRNDIVGVAGVDMARDAALVVIYASGVHDPLEHDALGLHDLLVERLQAARLGMEVTRNLEIANDARSQLGDDAELYPPPPWEAAGRRPAGSRPPNGRLWSDRPDGPRHESEGR